MMAPDMKTLIRQFDWSSTPVGASQSWPQSLRTTVDIMLASGHAMCVMWGAERTFFYNDAYAPMLGQRHPGALGKSAPDVWSDVWSEIAPIVERTFAGQTCAFEELPLTMTRKGFAEITWWDFCYSPVLDEHGSVGGLLNVTSDVTHRVLALRERDSAVTESQASEAFMASVLASSTDCIKVLDPNGHITFMSEGGLELMEIDDFDHVKGRYWPDFLTGEGPDQARAAIEDAVRGHASNLICPGTTLRGTPKFWSVSISPITGTGGSIDRVLAVSRDITDLEMAREQQRLLNGELAHRIKNTMSVVQAIAHQTLGQVTEEKAMKAFGDRLAALAASHGLLTGQDWSGAQLDEIARAALSTFGEERFKLSGPTVTLGPRATLSLSLMIHELATNAVKYGALSVAQGRVALRWHVQSDSLLLEWKERGGPPAVEPTRRGFGSRIIRMGLIGSGGVNLTYGMEGLTVEASAPLHQVQQA